MMETEEDLLTESAIESEDLLMSDEDVAEHDESKNVTPLSIDFNSRLTSDTSLLNPSGGSDLNFHEKESNTAFFCRNDDSFADATCEELDFSDDELPPSKSLQKINLDDVSYCGVNKSANSDSTFNQSCTVFKQECLTDAEYLSEEESDSKAFSNLTNCRRRLSGGLSLVDSTALEDKLKQGSVSIAKSFANSIFMRNISSSSATGEQTPLMTCLEFLKSEYSDEELTDIEEYSVKSDDGNESTQVPVHNLSEMSFNNSRYCDTNALDNDFRHCEMQQSGSPENVRRKSSVIVELLLEDETTNLGNEEQNILRKRNVKKLSRAEEFENDCPTDEESIDSDNKEWTETDESGCVRQVTVVKTETSINFEGDGEGEALDNDDLVSSTTTTTTTRVVTSVISDPDVQSEVESSFVQQLSGDDIRQSCEITFSDTVHDTSRPDE